jgi:hypothetical protein
MVRSTEDRPILRVNSSMGGPLSLCGDLRNRPRPRPPRRHRRHRRGQGSRRLRHRRLACGRRPGPGPGAGLRRVPRRGRRAHSPVRPGLRGPRRHRGPHRLRLRGRCTGRTGRPHRRPVRRLGRGRRLDGPGRAVRRHLPPPGVHRLARRGPGRAPPRPRLRTGARHLPPVCRRADPPPGRAHPPGQHRHPRGDHLRHGRDGRVRHVRPRGVRRVRHRGRGRLSEHGGGHRGADLGFARGRWLPHHPPRDPHSGHRQGRDRSWPPLRAPRRWPSPSPTSAPTWPG